ncbi:hypothetical protein BGZ96_001219 [Linnemannia gamsii]|uniref:Uncharacterized protein n=1 Tax=Linnemannia gamsii TaxID=64522 RepID=A0ABQ7KHI1_9FUNG|nr:hypothetical protein BGZ96_001219 [Linnemannia gamsii]
MQALTPLLFSMLFPRFSGTKNTADMSPDAEGHYQIESLLGARNSTNSYRNSTSSELLASSFSFGEGYPVDNNHNHNNTRSTKARRHHSTGTLLDSTAQSSSSSTSSSTTTPVNNIRRNNTVPQIRRVSRPERLSIDHAAFIATYPSLDGLGDMGYRNSSSSSSMDYYRNNNNSTANTANNSTTSPRRKASSSKLRKQQSQDTLPASRASTSSITSMVSDASSSSSSSSVSSVREPLTPTKSSNYHSIDGIDVVSSTKKAANNKRASMPVSIIRSSSNNNIKDNLIHLEAEAEEEEEVNRVKSLAVCQSPQSDNFFSTEEGFAGPAAALSLSSSSEGVVKARGQRQLIAH